MADAPLTEPGILFSRRKALAERHGMTLTPAFNALVRDTIQTFLQTQPPAAPLTPTDGELLSLIREKFALEELPMVWQGVKVGDHVNHWRCSDCDEEATSSPEIVHNKGCSYFTHMERIARENKIRARLQELAGITTHKDAP